MCDDGGARRLRSGGCAHGCPMGGEERTVTTEEMWRMAEMLRRKAAELEAEGCAVWAAYLRDDARQLEADGWAEVLR